MDITVVLTRDQLKESEKTGELKADVVVSGIIVPSKLSIDGHASPTRINIEELNGTYRGHISPWRHAMLREKGYLPPVVADSGHRVSLVVEHPYR